MDGGHGARGLRVLVRVRRWVPLRARCDPGQFPADDTRLAASRDRATFFGRVIGLKANWETLLSTRSAIAPTRTTSPWIAATTARPRPMTISTISQPAMQRHFTLPALTFLGQLDGSGRHPRVLRGLPLRYQPVDAPLLAVGQRSERPHIVEQSPCSASSRECELFILRRRTHWCFARSGGGHGVSRLLGADGQVALSNGELEHLGQRYEGNLATP